MNKENRKNDLLIAKFIGDKFLIDKLGADGHYKFNQSWNWLMPVVEKILNKHSSCAEVSFTGKEYLPKISFSILCDYKRQYHGESEKSLLEAVYLGVIQYIKDHNERK